MRDLFLLDPSVVFLNHGSFGACPRPVFEEYQRLQLELEREPVEFLGLKRRYPALIAAARDRLAAYVGASPADLVLVPNATSAVNLVARSLDLQPGDEVVGTTHEYGGNDLLWRQVCESRGARYLEIDTRRGGAGAGALPGAPDRGPRTGLARPADAAHVVPGLQRRKRSRRAALSTSSAPLIVLRRRRCGKSRRNAHNRVARRVVGALRPALDRLRRDDRAARGVGWARRRGARVLALKVVRAQGLATFRADRR
jgi:hypothetical protein